MSTPLSVTYYMSVLEQGPNSTKLRKRTITNLRQPISQMTTVNYCSKSHHHLRGTMASSWTLLLPQHLLSRKTPLPVLNLDQYAQVPSWTLYLHVHLAQSEPTDHSRFGPLISARLAFFQAVCHHIIVTIWSFDEQAKTQVVYQMLTL